MSTPVEVKKVKLIVVGETSSNKTQVISTFVKSVPGFRPKTVTASNSSAQASPDTFSSTSSASLTSSLTSSTSALVTPTPERSLSASSLASAASVASTSSSSSSSSLPPSNSSTNLGSGASGGGGPTAEKSVVWEADLLVEGRVVQLELVDACHDEHQRMFSYPLTDLFLICFSTDNLDSAKNILQKWVPELTHHCPGTPYGLLCTNTQLRDTGKECVTQQMGKEFVKRIRGVRYAEVSCLPPGEEEKKEEKKDERSKTIRGKSKEEKEREKMKEETVTAFMEAIASVVAPNKQEAKDISKRKKMLDKVTSEISLAVSEGKNEISFRKRALENSHIPKNMGKYMKEVKKLVLSDNKLFFFPVALLEMASLQVLELKNNTLMYLPKELPRMTALKKLDLENNQLRALPGEMGSMTHLEDLRLKGNPLEGFLPPEAMASGTRGVLAYLRDLHKGAERCYRMKLMFVGKEAAGKTSLSHFLINGKKLEKAPLSTDGIDIQEWDIPFGDFATEVSAKHMEDNWGNKPVTFSVWDFAGQEVYYSTHQFYLSRRSVYLCIFDLSDQAIQQGDYHRVQYWLQSIHAKAKGAPIIVVGTKQDLCTTTHVNETFVKMQAQFANFGVRKFMSVSCWTGKGIPELKQFILETALKQRTMGEQIPKIYLELEKTSEKKKTELAGQKKPPTVTYDEMRAIALAIPRLDDEEELNRAIEFLHELGSLVYFKKPGLSDIVILDPRWLTDVMATVVSSKTSLERGILPHKFLFSHIWKGDQYPAHLHPMLLLLLEKFQIAFRLRRRRQVLRAKKDVTGPTQNQLSFRAGDKILLLEKPKMGKWWKGVHNGQTGYFQAMHVEETDEAPDFTLEEESLVPCLLPVEPPSNLDKEWPAFDEDKTINQVSRTWKFDFLPLPFFAQLTVRMLHFTENRVLWRYGMIVENLRGTATCYLSVNHSAGLLSAFVRSNQQQALMDVMGLIEEEIDTVRDWFGVNFLEVLVPCSHCYKKRKEKPFVFNMDQCELAAAEDRKALVCEVDSPIGIGKGTEVPLVELVPDLAMAQYTKIPYQMIELGPFLGKGTFADVYKATYKSTTVAVKQLKNTKGFKEFRTEVKFMSVVEHPNIVMLKGICLNPPCIVTEYMELGNLHAYLEDSNTTLTWKLCLSIAEDVAKGMNFLHSQQPAKIHRDLKSPNILVTNRKGVIVAKVGDFGTARALAPTIGGRIVGNPIWLAPEVMRNEEYTEKADVYSYGIILWEIFSRQFPFGNKTIYQIELDVVEGRRPEFPEDAPPFYVELASDCWQQDPLRRPSFKQILERLRSSLPTVYRAKSVQQLEGALAVKVEKGDLLFVAPESKKGSSRESEKSVRCFHKGRYVMVPADYLKNECETIDYEGHFLAHHQLSPDASTSATSRRGTTGDSLSEGDSGTGSGNSGTGSGGAEKSGSLKRSKSKVGKKHRKDKSLGKEKVDVSELKQSKEEVLMQYGFHRVLEEPAGTLPQMAKRLDNTPTLMNSHEVLLSLHTLCVERTLMQYIKKKYSDITSGIMDIVPEHGKMHDPTLNLSASEGGFLLGTVQEIGDALYRKLDLKEGDRVIPICSLSSIPLRIISIGNVIGEQIIHVKGHAVIFSNSSFITVPQDVESEIALLAIEVASALSQVNRFVKEEMRVCILGCGRIGLIALCYLRKICPTAKIYCVDSTDARIEIANSLKKADAVQKVRADNAQDMLTFMKKHTADGFDLVLNCTSAQNVEMQAVLVVRQGGTVVLCSYAGVKPSNLMSCYADACIVLGGGACSPSLVESIFELLRENQHLRTIFAAFTRVVHKPE